MSASGLNYMLKTLFQDNKSLAAYYDFSTYNGEVDPASPNPYTGVFYNQFPAYDTGKYRIDVLSATGSSSASAEALLTGAISGDARLTKSNLRIPIHELEAKNMSAIIDFEWNGEVKNGVLIGSFDFFEETLGPETISGSKGWNFGFNDRGSLFFQSFTPSGSAVFCASNIELTKRNIIGLSLFENEVVISQFDYLNNAVYQKNTALNSNFISNPDYFYVGGSPKYFNTTAPNQITVSGVLHKLALFSGGLTPNTLLKLGSGILGEYYYNTGGLTTVEVVTGFNESITYKTGVTGVALQEVGTLTVSTGRHFYSGIFTGTSGISGSEGDDTYVFYNFDNGQFKTTYKEKIGYLDPINNFQYSPTGDNAFDTLGLQTGNFTLSGDSSLSLDTKLSTGSMKIYQRVEHTGILEEISGIINTPLTQTQTGYLPAQSGVNLNLISDPFKMDYIYYLGQRP